MPIRPRSHQLSDISINRLHQIFEQIGWTVEELAKDYGEDLLVRIFEDGAATPLKFFVQAKATDNISRFLNRSKMEFTFPIDVEHVAHWTKFNDPVILTIWDSQCDQFFWSCIQDATPKSPKAAGKRKTVRISIPCGQCLDSKGLRRIHSLTEERHRRLEIVSQGAETLRRILENKLGAKIDYSPDSEVLLIPSSDGGADGFIWGDLASQMSEASAKLGITCQEIFDKSMEPLIRFMEDGTFPVRNDATGKIENRKMTPEELGHYLFRDR